MTPQERANNIVILIAIGKVYSEQSAMLIGALKYKQKLVFNDSVKAIDLFVKNIESLLQPEEIEMIQGITDTMHTALNEVRNQN